MNFASAHAHAPAWFWWLLAVLACCMAACGCLIAWLDVAESATATPEPASCRHREAVPVHNSGEVVAWLCRSCDAQLPAEFSIYEEDL